MAETFLRRRRDSADLTFMFGLLLTGWATIWLVIACITGEVSVGPLHKNHFYLSASLFFAVHFSVLALLLFLAARIRCGWVIPTFILGLFLSFLFMPVMGNHYINDMLKELYTLGAGGILGIFLGLCFDVHEAMQNKEAATIDRAVHPQAEGDEGAE